MPSFKTPGEQPAAPAVRPATNPVCTLRLELGPHVSGWVNVPLKADYSAELAFLAANHPTEAGKLMPGDLLARQIMLRQSLENTRIIPPHVVLRVPPRMGRAAQADNRTRTPA